MAAISFYILMEVVENKNEQIETLASSKINRHKLAYTVPATEYIELGNKVAAGLLDDTVSDRDMALVGFLASNSAFLSEIAIVDLDTRKDTFLLLILYYVNSKDRNDPSFDNEATLKRIVDFCESQMMGDSCNREGILKLADSVKAIELER